MSDPKPHPDKVLADRAAGGDDAAWREIYTATRERLFSLLVYQIGIREEALDVLQDTYLAAWRGIKGYEGRASLESWLVGIAIRRALDWKRRALARIKRTDPIESHEPMGIEGLPQPDPETGRRLRRALDALSARQRGAFLLHEWLGYSFREIGDELGISENTARVHAFRARDALRHHLGEATETAPPAGLKGEGHERAL